MHEPFAISYYGRLWNASAEEQAKAVALFGDKAENPAEIFQIQDGVATINILGPLTKKGPSALALFFGFGGTGYNAIIEAVEAIKPEVEAGNVQRVDQIMDTPGGEVDGVDSAYQALAGLYEMVDSRAISTGMIASAGYYLAAPAGRIEAQAPTDMIGSIGVKIAGFDFTELFEKHGVKRRVIVSGNAPKKDRTLATEEGREILQREVDALERVFYMRIGQGRGVSADTIREKFGQGGILLAFDPGREKPDALSAGMIDGLTVDNVVALSDLVGEHENAPHAGDHTSRGYATQISEAERLKVSGRRNGQPNKQERGRGSANQQETQKMSLKQLLADNTEARAEFDKALADAKNGGHAEGLAEGKQKAEADAKQRGERVAVIMSADKSYPKPVLDHCLKVLKGEASVESLDTVVATADTVMELQASAAAVEEGAEAGTTAGGQQTTTGADGVAENEDQFQQQVSAAKGGGSAK